MTSSHRSAWPKAVEQWPEAVAHKSNKTINNRTRFIVEILSFGPLLHVTILGVYHH